MNRIYKIIWNSVFARWVVVSEISRSTSRTKRETPAASSPSTLPFSYRTRAICITLGCAVALPYAAPAFAGVGGTDAGMSNSNGSGWIKGSSGGGGVQYGDTGVGFVGDGDCSMLTSGPGSWAGVYGSGVNYLGGLFGFGAQNSMTSWGDATNAGANAGIVPFSGSEQVFGNVTYAPNNTQSNNFTTAFGLNSFAVGCGAHATGMSATALGWGTTASGVGSFATGLYSTASGQGSTAIGVSPVASETDTIAIGTLATANAVSGIAIGAELK